MTEAQVRQVLRADAVFDLLVGLLLLAATWGGLYDFLGLPKPQPEVFTQIAGALLIGFAYLLSVTPEVPGLVRPVARSAAIANGIGAFVILVWLVTGKLGAEGFGTVLFVIALILLVAFTYLQGRIGRSPASARTRRDRGRPPA